MSRGYAENAGALKGRHTWAALVGLALLVTLATGCGSDAEPETAQIAQPEPQSGADSSIEDPKKRLAVIVNEQLSGMNSEGRPRLTLPPDVREHRSGGLLVVIEFNGDEYEGIGERKAELDRVMRDTYEALFTAGYDLTEATMTAIMIGIIRDTSGGTAKGPIQVYRTRIRRDAADSVDWSAKETLDFTEIWETVFINPAWKRDLAALEQGE
jgi:hypothetical protein